MGPRSTLKAMRAAVAHLRDDAATLTREHAHYQSEPTVRARKALLEAVTEVEAAIRQHVERHDAQATPVQPPSKSQELRAASAVGAFREAGRILDEANPVKGEP